LNAAKGLTDVERSYEVNLMDEKSVHVKNRHGTALSSQGKNHGIRSVCEGNGGGGTAAKGKIDGAGGKKTTLDRSRQGKTKTPSDS